MPDKAKSDRITQRMQFRLLQELAETMTMNLAVNKLIHQELSLLNGRYEVEGPLDADMREILRTQATVLQERLIAKEIEVLRQKIDLLTEHSVAEEYQDTNNPDDVN